MPAGDPRRPWSGPLGSGVRPTTEAVVTVSDPEPATRDEGGPSLDEDADRATMTAERAGRAEADTPDDESRTT